MGPPRDRSGESALPFDVTQEIKAALIDDLPPHVLDAAGFHSDVHSGLAMGI